jgi:hypothetical protein
MTIAIMNSVITASHPELFAAAEIANFSPTEQEIHQNSLKYYRDMNNVVNTARQEGRQEGIELERSRVLERLSPQRRTFFL